MFQLRLPGPPYVCADYAAQQELLLQLTGLGPGMCDAAWDVYRAAEQRDMRVRTHVATKLMLMFAKAERAGEVNEIWAAIKQYVCGGI